MNKIKNSLFMKLVLLLTFVIIVPSVISNIIAYRQNYYLIRRQIMDWNSNMLEIGMEQTTEYMREVEQATLGIFYRADVIRILNKKTAFTDMERYVLRNFTKNVSDSMPGIYRVVMKCQNYELVDETYVADQTARSRISKYRYEEPNGEYFQVGQDESGRPACLIYNSDIENVPAFDNIVNIRIFADLKVLDTMTETLNGQYEDSVVMVYLGDLEEELAYSSQPFGQLDCDRDELWREKVAKGSIDGRKGIFFLKEGNYKDTPISLIKFVDNRWFQEPAQKVVYSAMIMQICLLLVSVVFLFLVFNIFISPVRRMLDDMKAVEEKPEFAYTAGTQRKDELGVLETQYAGMMHSLDELVNKNYRNELEMTKSRFKMLQAQINPHFLYNMLQYISTTALRNHCPEVSEQLTSLGELFQYTCAVDEESVELRRELHHLENYMSLQEGRFGGRLHFMLRCPQELEHIMIPRMILQPLVENSIKHGIDKKDGVGNIMVSVLEREGSCRIRVTDNGSGMTQEQINGLKKAYQEYGFTANTNQGIGFLNVLQRCKLFYGDAFTWEVHSIPDVETTVELVMTV